MSTTTLEPGARVRFTADNLGVIDNENARGFVSDVLVHHDDEGTVRGLHRYLDGWLYIDVEVDGRAYIVPVHASHVEAVR